MPNFNHVQLLGHMTREPQVKYLQSGTAVCEFGIAVNRRIKSGDEWKDKPVFVDCTCWARQAEFLGKYGAKGAACFVAGELDLDQWNDKDTGAKRSKLKVQAQTVQLLGKRTAEDQSPHNSEYGEESQVDPKFASDPPQATEAVPF